MTKLPKLVDFPFVVVRIECKPCMRSGAYRLARLAAKYGPDADMKDVLYSLTGDCIRAQEPPRHTRRRIVYCHAIYTDMPPRRPPDLPPSSPRVVVDNTSRVEAAGAKLSSARRR